MQLCIRSLVIAEKINLALPSCVCAGSPKQNSVLSQSLQQELKSCHLLHLEQNYIFVGQRYKIPRILGDQLM